MNGIVQELIVPIENQFFMSFDKILSKALKIQIMISILILFRKKNGIQFTTTIWNLKQKVEIFSKKIEKKSKSEKK